MGDKNDSLAGLAESHDGPVEERLADMGIDSAQWVVEELRSAHPSSTNNNISVKVQRTRNVDTLLLAYS